MPEKNNHSGEMPFDPESYAGKLYLSNIFREQVIRDVIKSLQLPPGSHGLDAGCGIGIPVLWLAKTVGENGHITGLDISDDLLKDARTLADNSAFSTQVSFEKGDIAKLPFDNNVFNWAWSLDCTGYYPGDPVKSLKELIRVVKPGGIVAILAWSSERLLPGYPILEARLSVTTSGIAPFATGMKPQRHFFRALGWFRELGLQDTRAQTFAGTVHAPLSDEMRRALLMLMQMRWVNVQRELSADDWAEFQRLTQPDSPDFILDIPDYYAFFTYTLFRGRIHK